MRGNERVMKLFSALILALATCFTGWAGAALAAPLVPLKVAYDGYSMTALPLIYAQKKGLFAKYGLDVQVVYIESGTTLTQAIVSGSVPIGQNGYTSAIAAQLQGADIAVVSGISNKLPFQLVVRKGITNAAGLKGKKIAVSRFGTSSDTATTYALRALGLSRKDVVVLQLGGEATRNSAMLSGQIDGAMEQYPRTGELQSKGFSVLVDDTKVAGDYPNSGYVANRAFIKAHPDLVKKFLMGLADGVHQFGQDRAGGIALMADFLKAPRGPWLDQTYDVYTKQVYPELPRPSLIGIDRVLHDLVPVVPRAASARPAQFVDTTALDQMQKEGFFAKLQSEKPARAGGP